jgi:hypothetical protein
MSFVYILRHQDRMIGFSDKGKPYLIGFPQQTHAYLTRMHLSGTPMVRFESQPMIALGTNDVVGKLSILKDKGIDLDQPPSALDVLAMDMNRFKMMPFQNKVGVVLPMELTDEDDDSYTFSCEVVEPENNI